MRLLDLPGLAGHALAFAAPATGTAAGPDDQTALSPERDRRAGLEAARRAAARALRLRDAGYVHIRRRPGRAPIALVRCSGGHLARAPLALSVTHRCGRAAALAAPAGSRVGIDLELVQPGPDAYGRYFLSPAERAATTLSPLELWACKEAAWKALGLGEADPFTALELCFARGNRLRAVAYGGVVYPARLMRATPWPRFVLAAVWVAGGTR